MASNNNVSVHHQYNDGLLPDIILLTQHIYTVYIFTSSINWTFFAVSKQHLCMLLIACVSSYCDHRSAVCNVVGLQRSLKTNIIIITIIWRVSALEESPY